MSKKNTSSPRPIKIGVKNPKPVAKDIRFSTPPPPKKK